MIPKVRLTHTGKIDSSIRIEDVDFGYDLQTRKVVSYIPKNSTVDLLLTDKVLFSFVQGNIAGFVEGGFLTSQLIGNGLQEFSEEVITTSGDYDLSLNVIQRYDASSTAPNSIVMYFPSSPLFNDVVGIKEVGGSTVSVELNGEGSLVEGIGVSPSLTQNISTSFISLFFKWDGSVWRII